jgi:enoyl-CoA hydratase
MTALQVETANGISTVTLTRPPVNALDVDLCRDLLGTFGSFTETAETRCVVLAGAGTRAFCAGLDFRAFLDVADDNADRNRLLRDLYATIHHCPVPVIAAIERPAIGAGSVLATLCDIRIAASTASFTLAEIDVGRIGGAAHHGRLLPQGTLRRMVYTGATMSADEAHRLGFVDELVPSDALAAALTLAARIAAKSPLSIRGAKRSLNEVEHLSVETGYEREQTANTLLQRTEDAREAVRAVMEKRPPVFKGR